MFVVIFDICNCASRIYQSKHSFFSSISCSTLMSIMQECLTLHPLTQEMTWRLISCAHFEISKREPKIWMKFSSRPQLNSHLHGSRTSQSLTIYSMYIFRMPYLYLHWVYYLQHSQYIYSLTFIRLVVVLVSAVVVLRATNTGESYLLPCRIDVIYTRLYIYNASRRCRSMLCNCRHSW